MANEHPFQLLFESFGRLPAAHAETVNRKAYDALSDALKTPVEASGRCILLRAPRAGHGKTHLLSRVQHQFGGTHEFIPLHAAGSRVDALSVTEDALKRLTRPLPAANGLTVLDLVVRRLFAYALQPLVVSGEVPCQDREGALTALKTRPVETFDFHHPNAVTAHWARENFEVLGPRLSMELSQRSGVAIREVSFWVNAFFHYAATPIDHPGRTGALGLEVAGEAISEGVAMERLFALLGMLSLLMRVVLVADDLEGFSADESAALRFAAFVGAIRQAVDRVDVILSLNKDIWETAFVPRLSGGLADRLSEVLIELEPLTDEDIVALFESRAPGLGKQVLDRVQVSERHARGLIRAAGEAWQSAAGEAPEPPVANPEPTPPSFFTPVIEPEPVFAPAEEAPPEPAAVEMPQAIAQHEPVSVEFPPATLSSEPIFAAEPAPVRPFEDAFGASSFSPPEFEKSFEAASAKEVPPVWGSGSVFEAQVLDEPVKSQPFSQEASAPVFQAAPPVAESAPSIFQAAPSVFEPVPPPAAEPAPSVFQAAPPVAEPAPSFFEPAPSIFQAAPPTAEDAPSVFEPAPSVFEPAPSVFQAAPSVFEAAPPAPVESAFQAVYTENPSRFSPPPPPPVSPSSEPAPPSPFAPSPSFAAPSGSQPVFAAPPQFSPPAESVFAAPSQFSAPAQTEAAAPQASPFAAEPAFQAPPQFDAAARQPEPAATPPQYSAPEDSPFKFEPRSAPAVQAPVEAPAPAYAPTQHSLPPQWKPDPQFSASAAETSPFSAAPAPAPASVYGVPAYEAPRPATDFGPPAHPAPQPVPAAAAEPAKESDSEADRVDDLLKQFRERYGRGSL